MTALVLLYHRVTDGPSDFFNQNVQPHHFAGHVQVLKEIADIVSLEDVLEADGVRIAITFDDGYANTALVAEPILTSAEAPATVFVVSGNVGRPREFWWYELEQLVFSRERYPNHLACEIGGRDIWIDVQSDAGRCRAYSALHRRLMTLPVTEIEAHLERMADAGGGLMVRDSHRPVSEAELRRLAAADRIDIAAHTVTHRPLAAAPPDVQRYEVEHSLTELSEFMPDMKAFAYPHGEYTDETIEIVRDVGFHLACIVGEESVGRGGDPLRIPRYIVRDWPAEVFRARVSEWLGAGSA